MHFYYLLGPFMSITYNTLHPKILSAKFVWNWHTDAADDFEHFQCISLFAITGIKGPLHRKMH